MKAREELRALTWPFGRLGEAIESLARESGLGPSRLEVPAPPSSLARDENAIEGWIESVSDALGIEAEPMECSYAELPSVLRHASPAVVRIGNGDRTRFLALLRRQGRRVLLLGPDLATHRVSVEAVCGLMCEAVEAPQRAPLDQMLREAGVTDARHDCARGAVTREQLRGVRVGGCWLLRLPAGTRAWRQASFAQLPRQMLALAGAHALQYVLWLVSWWMIGQWALQGRFDWGWFVAWAFLVALVIPLRLFETWQQGQIAFRAGALLKQRLLAGALRLEPEEMRHHGCGQLLGRVLEAETVESLALSGGFLGLSAVIELIVATVVLRLGAGGWLHVTLAAGWIVLSAAVMARYFQARLRWTDVRLTMTHDLVERMVGHRTRLAQAAAVHWHAGEDQMAEHYLDESARMDRIAALLIAVVPRGWLIVGVLGLVPSFVFGNGSPEGLAVGLGSVLLVFRALQKLSAGSIQWIHAATAWRQLRDLFQAAGRPHLIGSPGFAASTAPGSRQDSAGPLLQGHDLVFRYRNRSEPVLRGCCFQIAEGDRVLLEGSSGAGKSTLASLLTGLRAPESGLLLLRGLDQQTLGTQVWRRGAVAAPQFHENHVLTGTFAFNLLMGRRWPPREQDFAALEPLCRALGLGPVLDRMPAGLLEMVGESGWQLSHGEKSRLYVARALLQEADLVVLDESFAALDPENLRHALRCVLDRSRALVVIAHP